MKKISSSFYKDLAELRPQEKTVLLPFGEETFEVKIKDYLTLEERTKMFEDTIRVFRSEEIKEEDDDAMKTIVILMVIFKALTDVEFPEGVKEQIQQFTTLLEVGFVEKILKNFKEGIVEESALFLKEAMAVAVEQVSNQKTSEVTPEV